MNSGSDLSPFEAGESTVIDPGVVVGYGVADDAGRVVLGANCTIRTGTIVYHHVRVGDYFQTGHNAMIRELTVIGNHVVLGTNSIIDGNVEIADFVKIESNCYIPTHVRIGTRVFLGPGVVLTNDRYPLRLRDAYKPEGPVIEDDVTIGGGVTVMPGVRIGAGSFIAGGAVVTKDVPPSSLVVGMGEIRELPGKLRDSNMALSWRKFTS